MNLLKKQQQLTKNNKKQRFLTAESGFDRIENKNNYDKTKFDGVREDEKNRQVHQTDFSSGSVYKNILEVAILALTGGGLCFPIITLINAFTFLFGNGGSPLCAMELGRGNKEEAEKLMGNTFAMLLLTGAVLMTAGLLFYRPLLYLFGASDVTFSYAADYIRIYLLGTVFVMIFFGNESFYS